MALLKRVAVKGFRSIKEMDLELRPLNVLIGANGSGKSNFVSFFRMLNEMMAGRLQQYIGTTGRAKSLLHYGPKFTLHLEARLDFEVENAVDTYSMRLLHAAGDTLVFAEEVLEILPTGSTDPTSIGWGAGHQETRLGDEANRDTPAATLFRRLINNCRVYHFHDTSPTAKVREYCLVRDNRQLMPDAGNLAAMLYAYRRESEWVYKRIVSTIKKILPEFADFDLAPDRLNTQEIALNWRKRGSNYLFEPHQISDGTLRAMAIITLLLQPENDLPDVIILDEPELGLHPHALEIVAGLIRSVSLKSQVIVATQSQAFLEHFEPAEIVVVDSMKGGSRFRRLDPDQLKDWLEDYSIGELWEKNVLGGGPLP